MNREKTYHGVMTLLGLTLVLFTTTWVATAHGNETPTPAPTKDTPAVVGDVPTYYENIRPILKTNCMSCHTEGKFGHDSFDMDTPGEIIAGAEDIALVTSTRYMPPWPPSDLSPEFLYKRGLTEDEIAQIVAWSEGGAPLGEETLSTDVPQVDQAEPVVEADLTLQIPEPYTPNTDLSDDYRCFLMDPGFTQDTFITGYDIIPDNIGVVHHTVLFPGTATQRTEADKLNGADGKPGWQCFGGSGLSSGGPDMGQLRPLLPLIRQVGGLGQMRVLLQSDDAVAQLNDAITAIDTDGSLKGMIAAVGGTESLVMLLRQGLVGPTTEGNQPVTGVIGAWVPGSTPTQFPQNTGLLIPAGGFIIMQMHYNTQANDNPDQSTLILDTTEANDLSALRVLDINGPVEIPCPADVSSDACNRANSIAKSGEGSDTLLAICGQSLEQYAHQDPAKATTSCNYLVPTSGWAVSIMSHEHKLGQSTRTVLNPGTPDEKIMIDIPAWDFNWQGNYWFADPIWLNAGDTVQLTCVWDNSISRNNPEPKYVVGGEGTHDEMCLNFITMLPAEIGTPKPVMTAPHNHE